MTTEQWANALAFACFPAVNLFWFLYGTTAPWYRSWTGRAIFISKVGLAILVDSIVAYRLNDREPYSHQALVLNVGLALICVGTWMYMFAFLREQFRYHSPPRNPGTP